MLLKALTVTKNQHYDALKKVIIYLLQSYPPLRKKKLSRVGQAIYEDTVPIMDKKWGKLTEVEIDIAT